MGGKALKIGKRVIAFLGEILGKTWLDKFTFSEPNFIKSSVIDSKFKFIKVILDSADSKWVTLNHMGEIEIYIEKTTVGDKITSFNGGFDPY